MIVVIDAPLPDERAEEIKKLWPALELVRVSTARKPLPDDVLKRAAVIYTETADFDPSQAPGLRFVQTNSAATQPIRGKPIMRSRVPRTLPRGPGCRRTGPPECSSTTSAATWRAGRS